METPVMFRSADGVVLEALLARRAGSDGVIVTHPHSLYGGNMGNSIVETLTRVYGDRQYTTLRFNFRGVGMSEGVFAGGSGEQDDVGGAIDFLLQAGIERIHLAGYSFGAWVLAAMAQLPPQVCQQLHIAPPVAFMDYNSIAHVEKLRDVIVGKDDDIAPAEDVRARIGGWNPEARLWVIDGGDHFFSRTAGELERTLLAIISAKE